MLIPGAGNRMVREFAEYRPWKTWGQFDKEIGKYVGQAETDRLRRGQGNGAAVALRRHSVTRPQTARSGRGPRGNHHGRAPSVGAREICREIHVGGRDLFVPKVVENRHPAAMQ